MRRSNKVSKIIGFLEIGKAELTVFENVNVTYALEARAFEVLMSAPFREFPEMPTFQRWVKAFFRYIELVIITAGLAVAATKTMSPYLILPAFISLCALLIWSYHGVARELAIIANAHVPAPNDYKKTGWFYFVAFLIFSVAIAWTYMGTLSMLELLATLK